jgi:hypothetical protein
MGDLCCLDCHQCIFEYQRQKARVYVSVRWRYRELVNHTDPVFGFWTAIVWLRYRQSWAQVGTDLDHLRKHSYLVHLSDLQPESHVFLCGEHGFVLECRSC